MKSFVPPIIDIEASGFGRGSYPIEIGFALQDREIQSYLIRPESGWTHWSDQAEAVHHIPRPVLMKEGLSARELAMLLNNQLRGMTLYSDAWSHDSSWAALLFDAAELVQRFRIDSLSKLLTPDEVARWTDVKSRVVRELDIQLHRARNDVLALQETYLRVKGITTAPAV